MPSTMPEITANETMFGRIAVEQGHITPDQLAQALMLQGRDPRGRKLGEVMLDNGLDQLIRCDVALLDRNAAEHGFVFGDLRHGARHGPVLLNCLGTLSNEPNRAEGPEIRS